MKLGPYEIGKIDSRILVEPQAKELCKALLAEAPPPGPCEMCRAGPMNHCFGRMAGCICGCGNPGFGEGG